MRVLLSRMPSKRAPSAPSLHVTPPRDVPKPKTAVQRKERLERILKGLDGLYPDDTSAVTHHSPGELLGATVFSAQWTDKRVNEGTPGLFQKSPTVQDMASVSKAELANDIRS